MQKDVDGKLEATCMSKLVHSKKQSYIQLYVVGICESIYTFFSSLHSFNPHSHHAIMNTNNANSQS